MKRLDFIFFDAGGGHRSAALALKAVVERQEWPWEIRLVNLQEVLEPLDFFRKITGVRTEDLYNQMLKKGFTIGSLPMLHVLHGVIRLYHKAHVRLLSEFWKDSAPDLVVSLIPNFNRAIKQALDKCGDKPMCTILTDLADYPPHFWIEKQAQHFICGSQRAAEQARSCGHPDSRIHRTSGMILRPKFYDPIVAPREAERERLGLRPDLPTGLVLFGAEGSQWMRGIAERVSQSGLKLQLIFICGRNQKLRESMMRLKLDFPFFTEGFTSEVPYYMHLSDFFIGKPGPGSISEALAMKLPVMVERNEWTMVQERYNTEWVEQNRVGIVLDSFKHVVDGLKRLLEPRAFAEYRANAAAMTNRAVFEIPGMLNSILESHFPVGVGASRSSAERIG